MHPLKNSESTTKPFYPEPCTLLSRVFFCSINFCCLTVLAQPSSSHSPHPPPLFFFFVWTDPHCDRSTSNIQSLFWKGTGKREKGGGRGREGMFPNLPTAPLTTGSNTFGPRTASLSHTPNSLIPHKPGKPSAPRGETQKDYKDILQRGKRQEEKMMCCKQLCPTWQRMFAFHFPNSQEQSQIRTYSTTTCIHCFPPLSAKTG